MLSNAEALAIQRNLGEALLCFLAVNSDPLLKDVVRLNSEAILALLRIETEWLTADVDATCGAPRVRPKTADGSEVRCPHCSEVL